MKIDVNYVVKTRLGRFTLQLSWGRK